MDCRYGAPSFFTKRYSVNRHFYISNIIGHPYFDRISVGHRCRYFSHTDIVRRCSGIGRKRCGRCSDRIPNDCQPVFLSMHQAPIASGMELAGYGEKTVMKLGAPMTCLALVQQVLVTGWLFLADVL